MLASQRGAWSESLAIAHLIGEGYEVFIGLGNTSCDLVAVRDGLCVRVEVRTAARPRTRLDGVTTYAYRKPDPTKCDLMLLVRHDGTIDTLCVGGAQPI